MTFLARQRSAIEKNKLYQRIQDQKLPHICWNQCCGLEFFFSKKCQGSPFEIRKTAIFSFSSFSSIFSWSVGRNHFLNTPFDAAFQAEQDRLCLFWISKDSRNDYAKILEKQAGLEVGIVWISIYNSINFAQNFSGGRGICGYNRSKNLFNRTHFGGLVRITNCKISQNGQKSRVSELVSSG